MSNLNYCLYFQICVSSHMCLETVYSILGYWNYPLKNVVGETGCHITNLLRGTGLIQQQVHSFIMATTRYTFLFHDNVLLRFNLTINVSIIICLLSSYIRGCRTFATGIYWLIQNLDKILNLISNYQFY